MAKATYTNEELAPYLNSLSDADKQLNQDAQIQLAQRKFDWNAANTAGDKAGMERAHRAAEGIRLDNGGYYAGKSGDQYITDKDVYVSSADQNHFNADEMKTATGLKMQELAGLIPTGEANKQVEAIRKNYNYSGGKYGNEYLPFTLADGQDTFSYPEMPKSINQYQEMIQRMSNDLLNQGEFKYDPYSDPLYQLYAQQYTAGGQSAMQNTLAQIAARTGGLASSYAGTAAQNAYNGYMTQLANKIPELYQMAYGMYRDRINDQRENIAMLQGLSDSNYNMYADRRNFAYQNYTGNRDYNYQVGRDKTEDAREAYQFETQMNQQALETAADWLLNATGTFGDLAADNVDPNTWYALAQQFWPGVLEGRYWPGTL